MGFAPLNPSGLDLGNQRGAFFGEYGRLYPQQTVQLVVL